MLQNRTKLRWLIRSILLLDLLIPPLGLVKTYGFEDFQLHFLRRGGVLPFELLSVNIIYIIAFFHLFILLENALKWVLVGAEDVGAGLSAGLGRDSVDLNVGGCLVLHFLELAGKAVAGSLEGFYIIALVSAKLSVCWGPDVES